MTLTRNDILQAAATCTDLPSFPQVVLALEQAFQKEDASVQDIAALVAQDAPLSARFLKVANSALYASAREATDVRQAVLRLGLVESRRIAIASSLLGAFGAMGGADAEKFWQHNLAVALIAEGIAKRSPNVGDDDVSAVFTAAILHDLGAIVLTYLYPEEVAALASRAHTHGQNLCMLEAEVWGVDHAEVGATLAETWGLPSPLPEVIRHHHHPLAAPDDVQVLAQVVHVANFMANNRGFRRGEETHQESCSDGAFDALGFDMGEIPDLIDEVEELGERGEQMAQL